MRVEVKGLSGPLGGVTLTRREVEHARTTTTELMLIVVHGIDVKPSSSGSLRGSGGQAVVFNPWQVDAGRLDASAYDYQLPPLP